MLVVGCFRRLASLVLVLLVLAVAWWFRHDLAEVWRSAGGDTAEVAPSPELADRADGKLEDLASGRNGRAVLSEVEIQSLLEYRYRDLFPSFVHAPQVSIESGRLRLEARVPTSDLGPLPGIEHAQTLLPDTAEVSVLASVLPLDAGRVALAIEEVTAARIPVPSRIVPGLLERIGRVPEPTLPEDALALRLPPGAHTAYVRGDSLFLLADTARTGG